MGLLVEDYRPNTVKDCILPDRIKEVFVEMIKSVDVNNSILSGPTGTGKTSVAIAMCKELNIDYMLVNSGLDADASYLRNQLTQFASTMSLEHGKKIKVVIFDEGDKLRPAVQGSLLPLIEKFSKSCRFIFTCNYPNKLDKAIHSRCSLISFAFTKEEADDMMKQFALRTFEILDIENIEYDRKSVAMYIKKLYPDMRKALVEMQSYSKRGKIDSGIMTSNASASRIKELLDLFKEKPSNWKGMRMWTGENIDIINSNIFSVLYKELDTILKPTSVPEAVVLMAEYQEKHELVADKEINFMAFMTELLMNTEVK